MLGIEKRKGAALPTPQLQFLYELGFAIHWLRPRSKKPVKTGWTSGPRASLEELLAEYKPGFNPGVRLGAASRVGNKYLAIVDLDIKSEDIDHYTEALDRLYLLFPQVKDSPYLRSGRGNGSAHYYILINAPVGGGEVKARSRQLVKVKIPSVAPSDKDTQKLTPEDLAAGYRLRPAWEIQLLSQGRQAVLVDAIHPDTNQRYSWGKPILSAADIPIVLKIPGGMNGEAASPAHLPKGSPDPSAPAKDAALVFTEDGVDDFDLPDHHKAAIVSGAGVVDRSHYLYDMCLVLVQKGYSDNRILSVLTRRDYFLGQVAYKNGNDTRVKAARWLYRFELSKARKTVEKNNEVFDFDEEPIVPKGEAEPTTKTEKPIDNGGRALPPGWFGQVPKGIKDPFGWQGLLTTRAPRKKVLFVIETTLENIVHILKNSNGQKDILKRDLFSRVDHWCCLTIWGHQKGDMRSSAQDDTLPIKLWLSRTYGIEPHLNLIDEALSVIALQYAHHPLKDYLNSLRWDGVPRVEKFFSTYLGAAMPEPYQSAVTRKFFQACVMRAFEPGAEFDHVIVLEGFQGKGKSKFLQRLAGKQWAMDGLPNLKDKDAALYLQGAWLCEFEELAALARTDQNTTKGFITRNVDKFRPPYGRTRQDFPRTTVFIGTTDKQDYLMDTQGNRRFWPIKVQQLNFALIEKDRDQIWAEAVFNYSFDREPYWLEDGTPEKIQSVEIQEQKRSESDDDFMKEIIRPWLGENDYSQEGFKLSELFQNGPLINYPINGTNLMLAGKVLRDLGLKKIHTRKGNVWM